MYINENKMSVTFIPHEYETIVYWLFSHSELLDIFFLLLFDLFLNFVIKSETVLLSLLYIEL